MADGAYARHDGPFDRARGLLERWLRVPPPPEAPAGSPGSVRRFRAAPGFYRYRLLQWGLKQVGALWGLIVGLTFVAQVPDFRFDWLLHAVELLGVATFVLLLPATFLLVRVDYDYRWYLVTDRGLRIREGIYRIREQTMSFANVQNLSIQEGPLQRLLGISDLRVRTAGGGGGGRAEGAGGKEHQHRDLHLGFFRGVDDAEAIRDLILDHLRHLRDSGLGDPDEEREAAGVGEGTSPQVPPGRDASDATVAARELLAAARELRGALSSAASPAP